MSHKVLILSEDFPPYPGGIAQWARGVATALARQDVNVHILTRHRDDYPAVSPHPNVEIHFVYGRRWAQFRTMYYRRALKNFLERECGIDAAIATTWNVARGLHPIFRREGIRLITVIHGMEVTRPMPVWKRTLLLHTLYNSDLLVAVSRFTAQQVLKLNPLLQHKMRVFPNGVDPQRFRPDLDVSVLRHRYSVDIDTPVLLTLARVIERKGHDIVIRALPKILRHFPTTRYLICGPAESRYRQHLQDLARQQHVESAVIFEDYIAEDMVPYYYNLCSIYLMISRTVADRGDVEGFGITYLEANACGKPVIGSTAGGIGDAIIDGVTGLLVPPDDPSAVAAAVCQLLSDPQRRQALGMAGRQRILTELNWDDIVRRMLPVLLPLGQINFPSVRASSN